MDKHLQIHLDTMRLGLYDITEQECDPFIKAMCKAAHTALSAIKHPESSTAYINAAIYTLEQAQK
jgi:hypothetical protein